METKYPNNLYDYYRNNPSKFEERVDSKKRTINYVLTAVCLILLIFPSIVPIGNTLVRIIAGIALLYYGYSAFFGSKYWYNLESGGKITESAIKKFEYPWPGYGVPGGESETNIRNMFEDNDFAGLADEPEKSGHPLQLYIEEDKVGKIFYMQLMFYFSSSDFRGITDVKEVKEPYYSQYYQIIKSIKST